MLGWMVKLVGAMNYWGVALLMAIENVVLPLPSELIMPLAGFQTVGGRMTLWGVTLAGTIGSVVGALPIYLVARAVGEERLEGWVERHGKWLLLRRRDLQRASARFRGNTFVAVTVAQLLPGVRGLISLPAGFARMNILLFALANFVGTIVWCGVLALGGRLLGANFQRIHHFLGPAGWALVAALLVGGVVWSVRHRRRGPLLARR
jgi:membrane protein DedA with SNARE-associated domain